MQPLSLQKSCSESLGRPILRRLTEHAGVTAVFETEVGWLILASIPAFYSINAPSYSYIMHQRDSSSPLRPRSCKIFFCSSLLLLVIDHEVVNRSAYSVSSLIFVE